MRPARRADEAADDLLDHWRDKGWILIRSAIERPQVERTVAAIFDFLEMAPDRPQDWYCADLRARSGIDRHGRAPFYHHQTLWDNRQNRLLHDTCRRMLRCDDLLVSIDRVNMNPPVQPHWDYAGFIHWDFDVKQRPVRPGVQGLLALTDDDGDGGGFQCVEGFHHHIDAWLDRQPPGYCSRFPDTAGMCIRAVPMKAGDFLMFHGALPHGNAPNHGTRPRLAQYITYFPRATLDAAALDRRLSAWRLGDPPESPAGKQLPAHPSKRHQTNDIRLSALGSALLGLVPH